MLYSEAARQRDLQRYYQPWVDAAQNLAEDDEGEAKGLVYRAYEAKSSFDKSLTAFAQLIVLRLNVKRAMVSLIDASKQYILAEATKSLSLSTQSTDAGDEMWLGHAIIARNEAVCYHTFGSEYTALDSNGETYVTDALIIPDCRLDPRVADRDYVLSEPGVRFYAGVPIITKAGYRIGVFAVSDDKPRDGLSATEVKFMEDISLAVMEHLELAKDSDDRSKGERMVRGLTEFIERSSTQDTQTTSMTRQTTLEKQTENARLEAIGDDEPLNQPSPVNKEVQQQRKPEHERENDKSRIFRRAARIIRLSTRADGVVFFDTSHTNSSIHSFHNATPAASSDEYSSTTAGSATTLRKKKKKSKEQVLSGSGDDAKSSEATDSHACPVVGLSMRSGNLGVSDEDFAFTEAAMERYIARYPAGKFFNFDEEGIGINSSDDKSEKSEAEQSDKMASSIHTVRKLRPRKDRFVPTELLRVLPNVRSLIFLPLWDPTSERWSAGGFIWTMATGRLMNSDSELPYLKAFGNTIVSEVARMNAQKSDRAKTTFIASISHELRSPLHGILGSVEFLQDSVSSSYQQSLVSSIETCGRTLLDTIDHVLDYAKINKLRSANSKRKQRGGKRGKGPSDNSILGVTTVFNLSQLVEEVCDTVCAGHAFRRAHDHQTTFHDQGMRSRTNSVSNSSANTGDPKYSGVRTKDRVVVALSIAPFVQWIVKSQPGALRRVVMNLLGNALKYTDTGFITVSLEQDSEKSSAQWVEFVLTVEDSGKGMSTEFQTTRLFAPFSQEDPFSNGTGLGLSIVKQIVESLRGEVSVVSTIRVGTKISIHMKLPVGKVEDARTRQTLLHKPGELKDKSASMIFPEISLGGAGEKLRESMIKACQNININTFVTFDSENEPDFLVTEPDTLMRLLRKVKSKESTRSPLVVICVCTDPEEKTFTQNRLRQDFPLRGWIIEVVAQPLGPRRLATMLLDGLHCAAQPVEHLEVRAPDDVPPPSSQVRPIAPVATVHRSISELVRGSAAVPPFVSGAHSPLIAANMPTGSEPTATGQIPSTPLSEGPAEYFTPRVLLVDDNAINLKLLVVFSQRQNLRFSSATNGLIAFETFKTAALATTPPSKPFDFVLMDLSMPVMDGLESTRRIRGFEVEMGLPPSTIVALTGLASAQDQQDAVDSGMDLYLVKPVKFGDIKRLFFGEGR